jgi:general secretion pathway protein D
LFIGEDQVIATGIDAGSINQVDNGNTTSTTATETSLNTEVKKIGSTLALLPSVNDDLTVTIDIFQSTSSLKRNGMSFPFFNTQTGEIDSVLLDTVEESTLKTIVVARDGYTVALGGMINESKLNEYTTVPILGDIPFLGELFKTKSEHESSGQYLMLITPHIIVNPEEGMNKTREISDINFDKYADVELGETVETKGEALQIPDFISLARYAGNDFFGYEQTSNLKPKPLINTLSVESKSHTNLLEEGLSVTPLKSYQQGGLYVTVAGVKNTSNEKQYLEVKDARGNWLAVASESRYLLSKNDQNTKGSDYGYLYFISDKSFSESLPIGE